MNANGNKLKHIDIFSGIGGFSLAFESEGFETVGFVECDERKRIVLRHWWPGVRIFDDARDVDGIRGFCESIGGIDVLTGGVPCQPASALGQMRGSADERWLWPDTIRLVRAIRPRFAVFENPPSLLVLEGGGAWNGIVSGLVASGYDLWWDVFPAAAFGAGHLRERVVLCAADADWTGLEGHAWNGARNNISGGGVFAAGSTNCRGGYSANYLPTPIASDGKSRGTMSNKCIQRRVALKKSISLSMVVPSLISAAESSQQKMESLPGGMRITPEFQCWLMGFPPNWLKPLRDALGTPSCPKSSNQSPEPSTE